MVKKYTSNPRSIAHLALLMVALIYGINYSVAKDVMPGFLEPRGFILLRAIGATALFWITARFFRQERILKEDYPRLVICGFFGVAANQLMFFEGLNLTTPINASVMMTVNPVLVLLLSAIMLRENLRVPRILGIALGLGGALLLITRAGTGPDITGSDKAIGNLLVLLNAASYAAYLVLVKPLMSKYKPLTVIRWVFTFGLFLVLPFGAGQLASAEWSTFPSPIIWKIVFVVVATTYLAYLLNVFALKTLSSTTVGFYIYLQPFFAGLVAIALGKDQITVLLIVASTLIFTGIYLVSGRTFRGLRFRRR